MNKKLNTITLCLVSMFLFLIVSCTTNTTKEYTITYETYGGTIIESEVVEEGSVIPNPINPVKEGYIFDGWYLEETFVTPVDFNDTVTEDITLYAKWNEIDYNEEFTITYVLNGSTNHEDNPTSFTRNTLPIILGEPTLKDKHFVGWYYNGNKIVQIPQLESFAKDITLEAVFEDIFVIKYTGRGSELVDNPSEYYPSSGAIPLNLPEMEGFTFIGWLLNGGIVTEIPADTTGNIILTTVYEAHEFTITYDLDGGVNASTNRTTYTGDDNSFRLKAPTKEGYTFLGWMLDGEYIEVFDTSMVRDVTLTAVWELAPIYHEIRYYMNGGSIIGSYDTKYEEGVGLTLPTVEREGYTFLGWNTSNNTTDTYITKIPATATHDYVLYAIFEKIVVYSDIVYHLNGGAFESDVVESYEEGVGATLPVPSRDGYDFVGWFLYEDFSGLQVEKISTSTTGDVNVYAKWESNIPTYIVTYNLNGGAFVRDIPYNTREEMVTDFMLDINTYYGTSMTLSSFFDASYNVAPLSNFFGSEAYKDKWSWVRTFFVEKGKEIGYSGVTTLENEGADFHNNFMRANLSAFLNANYRSDWPASMDFSDSVLANSYVDYLPGNALNIVYEFTADTETFTLPEVSRTDFTFLGWYDNEGNLVTEITKGTTHDVVLNAKFQSIYNVYTITYMVNGGTLSSETVFEFTEKDEFPLHKAEKLGYYFVGWYEESDFSGSIVTDIPLGTNRDITLYARYRVMEYQISYNANGGTHSNPTSYTIETDNYQLQAAVKPGYAFLGWYDTNGNKVEIIEKGTIGKIELYAEYETIVDPSIKYTVTFINENGDVYSEEEVCHGESVSEILLGTNEGLQLAWFYNGELYDFNTKLEGDITLEAKWRVIDDIYNSIFYDKYLSANVKIVREYMTDMGNISIVWRTSNGSAINTASGLISPDYEDQHVNITGTFKLGSESFTVVREYIVKKVEFRDLTTGPKATFGYLYSNVASMQVPEVVYETIDVINYSFARVTADGGVSISELRYIEKVAELRKQGIRVILCIGGYGNGCKEFSDAALTQQGREKLAAAIVDIVVEYHFDGVDIDWEYPGYDTGRDVSIDRPNFTLLMEEIRDQLKAVNPEYLVTAALPGGKYGYTRYEIGKLNDILDYIHLMTYDLQATGTATHHSGLYNGSYTPHGSVEQTVNTFISQGASKEKLIVGIAFYGRKFNVTSTGSGIGCVNNLSTANSIRYTNIYNEYLVAIKNGSTTIQRYWDDKTKAPYIYDKSTKIWITYEDPESIAYKCEYVETKDLAGVMFWDYGEDQTFQLIQAIHDNLR